MTHILNNIAPTTDTLTALERSPINWTVSLQSLYDANGDTLKGFYGTYRDDKPLAEGLLGVVKGRYEVMQHDELCGIPSDMIAADPTRGTEFASAGELNGGRRVYASVKVNSFEVVAGDQIQTYFVVTTSHDGTRATQVLLSSIRPICANTLNAGIREAKGKHKIASIRHTSSSHDRLAEARRQLQNTDYTSSVLCDQLRTLAGRRVTRENMVEMLDRLFPKGKDEEAISTRNENKRAKFLEIFELNDDNAFPIIRGTAYNALNAYTNFTDHHSAVTKTETRGDATVERLRQESAVFGTGAARKQQALEMMLELTANSPSVPTTIYSTPNDRSVLDSILDASVLN